MAIGPAEPAYLDIALSSIDKFRVLVWCCLATGCTSHSASFVVYTQHACKTFVVFGPPAGPAAYVMERMKQPIDMPAEPAAHAIDRLIQPM